MVCEFDLFAFVLDVSSQKSCDVKFLLTVTRICMTLKFLILLTNVSCWGFLSQGCYVPKHGYFVC